MDSRYFDSDKMPDDIFKDMFTSSTQVPQIKQALHISKPDAFAKTSKIVAEAITDRN